MIYTLFSVLRYINDRLTSSVDDPLVPLLPLEVIHNKESLHIVELTPCKPPTVVVIKPLPVLSVGYHAFIMDILLSVQETTLFMALINEPLFENPSSSCETCIKLINMIAVVRWCSVRLQLIKSIFFVKS